MNIYIMNNESIGDTTVETVIRQFEMQAVLFASRFTKDAAVRDDYMRKTKKMSEQLLTTYKSGNISAKQAATAAHQMRNEIMEFSRVSSSDLGRAKALKMKLRGLDLDQLINKYAAKKYSKAFDLLNEAEKNTVFLEIVSSSGRANPKVNAGVKSMSRVGRGLWVLTALLAIYNVSNAENKVKATGREAANIGGGFAGGAGGGALAGIWFGPVGVAVGVIVGGTLGALMSDHVYVELAGPDGEFARKFIPRFTSFTGVDESAMANALFKEVSYEADKALNVFRELNDKYTTDADDIAFAYVELLQNSSGPTRLAVKNHTGLRNYLITLLDEGWTSEEELSCIRYLQNM